MKIIIVLVLVLVSFVSAYDRYLKEKKVYLCKTIECTNDYGFESYIVETFKDSLSRYVNFIEYEGVNEKELIKYNSGYPSRIRNKSRIPKFNTDFLADYYIILRVKIKSYIARNKSTTFTIHDATFKNIEYGNFTIGNDGKNYNQYYVSIEAFIYSVDNSTLYYYMSNENDSHEEKDVFNEEIKYNIDECIEDFPDKFNDSKTWKYYKKLNNDPTAKKF